MNREQLETRISLIDEQLMRVSQDIQNLNSHYNMLEGGKQEALHWLQQIAIHESLNPEEKVDLNVPIDKGVQ